MLLRSQHCTGKFEQLLSDPEGRCRFVGNVAVGRDVSVAELQAHYDAVVLAYGAEDDRHLGVPGEDLPNVHAARDFVGWYNGAPDCAALSVNLDCERAVVVGVGNVALDVARVLLTPVDVLRKTDIAEHALAALSRSRVRAVDIVGRRGPVQAAFTIKEFRELTTLAGVRGAIHRGADVAALVAEARPQWETDRSRRRLIELIDKTARQPIPADVRPPLDRLWTLRFLQSPIAFQPDRATGRVGAVRLVTNALDPATQDVRPTETAEDVPAGLVVRSIGYRARALPGVPFDPARSSVPNAAGRVIGRPGLYVAGWLRSGPVGVIASTLGNAHETADAVLADWNAGPPPQPTDSYGRSGLRGRAWLEQHLRTRGVAAVSTEGWRRIDAHERAQGVSRGADRVKVVDLAKMIELGRAPQHA